jgi:lipoprotein-releasing system permease protein
MLVVTTVTLSMVIVLSVFNGMEDIIRKLYNTFDPDLQITAVVGKSFEATPRLLNDIKNIEGVAYITEVIEDNAIASYKDEKDVVKIKGVSENFLHQKKFETKMVAGKLLLHEKGRDYTVVGAGVQYKLSIALNDVYAPLRLYYPNRKKIRKPDAPDAFHTANVQPAGVFAIEKQYDDLYVLVSLDLARDLLDYGSKRTSLEIKVKEGYTIEQVKNEISSKIGETYKVLDSDEQHAGIIRAIRIEKLAVYIILSALLAVSSVGIYFCLTMLTIRKRKDIAVLKSMGASVAFIRKVFLIEGMMIAFVGAALGLIAGFAICYVQQRYGLVQLGMETSIVKAYPVKMEPTDFLITAITVFILTLIASYWPARNAAYSEVKDFIK